MQHDLRMFAVVHLLNFFTAQKKHVLTHFALDMAVIAAVMWKHCMVEGRDFFPLILIYLECQRKVLSEHRAI